MATVYASPTGSDSTGDGSSGSPFRTVNQALTAIASGTSGARNTVAVRSGTYPETAGVSKDYVDIVGDGDTMPIIDGEFTRTKGITVGSTRRGVTLRDLEVRNQTQHGIEVNSPIHSGGVGTNTGHVIEDCFVHDILSRPINGGVGSPNVERGIYCVYGNPIVRRCEVGRIGFDGEAMGVYTFETHNAEVRENNIYLCRKNGWRGYRDLNTIVDSNRVSGCWLGLDEAGSVGAVIQNNYVFRCTYGAVPKHANNPTNGGLIWTLVDYDAVWTYFRHNTFRENFMAHIALHMGGAGGKGRNISVRNNIFSHGGVGFAALSDSSTTREGGIVVDNNVYGGGGGEFEGRNKTTAYHDGSDYMINKKTFAQMQADLGWEAGGASIAFTLNDPDTGDLDYPADSPVKAYAADLTGEGSPYGNRMGARGLAPARVTLVHPGAQTVHSRSASFGTYNGQQEGIRDRIWTSQTLIQPPSEQHVVLDLGAEREVSFLQEQMATHLGGTNSRKIRVELALNAAGPWATVVESEHGDAGGADGWFAWPAQVARYVRFTSITNFGSTTYTVLSGFIVGNEVIRTTTDLAASIIGDPIRTAGETLQVSTAGGTAPLAYQWQRDGADIAGATSSSYVTVDPTDENKTLTCVVTDVEGETATSSVFVQAAVDPEPPPPYVPSTDAPYWGQVASA